jgi:tricorn protease
MISFFLAAFLLTVNQFSSFAEEKRPLMRFPDVYGDTVVFVYGGDIWSAPTAGGVAQRLTIHDGGEVSPKFSPDGSMIAFTGEYDGNGDVYVMNIHGGGITRVTYHPGYDEVVGWHPLKNKIIFRSMRRSFSYFNKLFLIAPDGTGFEELILHEAGNGSFSSDGKKIAYNKLAREGRTWKRYRGGTAQELYIYDFEKNEDKNISNFKGTDRIPMWIGDKIYFSTDRDRVLNVYSYDTNTGNIEQITTHKEYDVRRPSMGGNKIIYELGGELWLLDVNTKETKKIAVDIRADAPETRPYLKKVDEQIQGFNCSPSGKRALVAARGEIFSIPKKDGPTRNLTKDSGAKDKDAVWSPDGKKIAYFSDKAGEYNIYVMDLKDNKDPVQLTNFDSGYRHSLSWSPDSKKLSFADQTLRLHYIDVDTKKITEVDKAQYENVDVALDKKAISDYSWSPDSRYIAYSKMDADLVYKVYIFDLEKGEKHLVSTGIYNDFNPIFSKDGEHLIFISNRRFSPTFCDFEWEMVYKNIAGLYSLTLKKDGEALFPYKSDEEKIEEGDEKEKDEKGDDKKDKKAKKDKKTGKKAEEGDEEGAEKGEEDKPEVVIDFEGLYDRIESFPLKSGNYRDLAVNDSSLFYLNAEKGDFNRFEFRQLGPRDLYSFSFEDRKESKVIEGIGAYTLSADGSSIIYIKGKSIGIIESSTKDSKGESINLSDMKMWLDPTAEWKQIFNEAWRMERDFYYEPGMHGLDWAAMKEKYGKLLPFASNRSDIGYIVGELIAELNTSHTYVFGGDFQRKAEMVNVGLLGVDWEVDEANNLYRFKKIYRVPDWSMDITPPLLGPDKKVNEGDYLLQVNGENVTADRNIFNYFQDTSGKQVTLLVNSKPDEKDAREFTVIPSGSEYMLRYLDWTEQNRQVVEKESDGEIGYIHLPDTYTGSAREFPKFFYGQTRKRGIIIDGRFNGGGLDPDIFLQRLDKDLLTYWTRRYSHDQTTPAVVTRAHMACLTNKYAGSGGDMLPMEFQMRKMGPVIGTRTWGGLVGLSAWLPLIDGGILTAPDYRLYDPEGKWIVENVGVEPDIVVDLHSAEVAKGYDAQLMKAIEYLKKKIAEDPREWPEHEPFPVDK